MYWVQVKGPGYVGARGLDCRDCDGPVLLEGAAVLTGFAARCFEGACLAVEKTTKAHGSYMLVLNHYRTGMAAIICPSFRVSNPVTQGKGSSSYMA